MGYPYDTDELYHHGVKGMRWGVRKYYNPNGTLTEKGKKRYAATAKQNKNGTMKRRYTETKSDQTFYGKRGARRIADRRNRGQSVKTAYRKELGIKVTKAVLATTLGGVVVTDLATGGKMSKRIINNGTAAARRIFNTADNARSKVLNTEILDETGKVIKRYRNAANARFVD